MIGPSQRLLPVTPWILVGAGMVALAAGRLLAIAETTGFIVLGGPMMVKPGFATRCFGPYRLPDEAKSIYRFTPTDTGPIMGMNVYFLEDGDVPVRISDPNTEHYTADLTNMADFEKAFEDAACFTRAGDPRDNARYKSPSVYDWDGATPSGAELDFSNFAAPGVGFVPGRRRNVLFEAHYISTAPQGEPDESQLVLSWSNSVPTRPVKSLALKDGNPPLRIEAGSIGTYQSTWYVIRGGAILSYHGHFHNGHEIWLEVLSPSGTRSVHFHRGDKKDENDERFREANPPVVLEEGSEISIHCEFDATQAKVDIVNPVEMCLFYLHVDESLEVFQ